MKGMVFGVFDKFHKGHEYFLTQARGNCDELIVVVTLAEIVELIKKRLPTDSYKTRVKNIENFKITTSRDTNAQWTIIPGDNTLGAWQVLKDHKPDIIFLGYDQHGIATELTKMKMPFTFLDAYFPEKFKTSLM